MTLYLWHIPAIAVATFTLHAFGLDAYDVDAPYFWAMLALRAVVFAVVMLAMFMLLSPLEHRRLPWWDAPVAATGTRSTAAGVLIVLAGVALVLLAKNGLGDLYGLVDARMLRHRGRCRADLRRSEVCPNPQRPQPFNARRAAVRRGFGHGTGARPGAHHLRPPEPVAHQRRDRRRHERADHQGVEQQAHSDGRCPSGRPPSAR